MGGRKTMNREQDATMYEQCSWGRGLLRPILGGATPRANSISAYCLLIFSGVICVLFTGIVFGFVPLQAVMIDSGAYSSFCSLNISTPYLLESITIVNNEGGSSFSEAWMDIPSLVPETDSPTSFLPASSSSPSPFPPIPSSSSPSSFSCSDIESTGSNDLGGALCTAQILALQGMFTISTSILNLVAFPVGCLLDIMGSRASTAGGLAIAAVGCILFSQSIYLPGFTLMGIGGMATYMSQFYLSSLFPQRRGLVYGWITGCFNASTSTFLFVQPLYNLGLSLELQFLMMALLAICLSLTSAAAYPSPGALEEQDRSEQAVTLGGDCEQIGENRLAHNVNVKTEDLSLDVEKEEEDGKIVEPGRVTSWLAVVYSKECWGLSLYLAFSNLFLLYYLATLDLQLEAIAPQSLQGCRLADQIGALFFYMLPLGGFISIPLCGYFLDTHGEVAALLIGRAALTLCALCLLLPSLYIQIFGFLCFYYGNLTLWAGVSASLLKLFGERDFGRSYGFAMTVSGAMGFSLFLLSYISIQLLDGVWYPVNIFMLISQMALTIVPLALRKWLRTRATTSNSHQDSSGAVEELARLRVIHSSGKGEVDTVALMAESESEEDGFLYIATARGIDYNTSVEDVIPDVGRNDAVESNY